ncbi:MAG: protein translocase subunit SecDF [Verrucomicrobia bacterium CG_4_10_14_3_um_filter_43_23]|nr:MAG: preprotein translocase subunit SecD [Verrucomicrobia bacterium CG1_02_43_26]PIP58872.1 MAG: protein translocase subunit SecDF [Verrucomicrobia bacterium CG22_combo_CG10-13_8_21_14_all_43_17]PIX57817.1 MAG: protein translocase subunit SecDF [Verrucomicrobia bacterium CG_4_10_14_3_um_filter_43_23]PIY62078.1 MAG: protein translocase subunit SecDF [Verrucomicrobia bacterium CG_4_10_14_0_8_um_filter_43_34]PJA44925.1 MAG: protein translocase subunit SecDF [Verrucomicrobia bacterium CG_4_9_14_
MTRSILGRLILTLAVLAWALFNIIPYKDKPFNLFVKDRVSANTQAFGEIYMIAEDRVAAGKEPSLYVALINLGHEEKIDFSTYFPDVNLADIKNLDKRNEVLLQYLLKESQGKIKLGLDLKGGMAFTLKIDDAALANKNKYERKLQLEKAIDIMQKRVNGLGVADPIIRAKGSDQLEIQLPGLSTAENPDVLANLQKPAKLTFHRVHRTKYPTGAAGEEAPTGYLTMVKEDTDQKTGEIREERVFVRRVPDMGGNMVKSAHATMNQYGGYEISLSMTSEGADHFASLTKRIADENNQAPYGSMSESNPAKYGRLAIVLDGKLYSAPRVTESIPGGHARISGQFSQRDALELANVLNNPLEFELTLTEMSEIGPSLADDARNSSINAALLGAALVILFMIVYYNGAGFVSVIAVLLNVIVVLGVLASLDATLTLPGVAALVLTVGMAVDANILIYERIREELRAGKSTKAALSAGFEKAFSTIVDANITTLLTACILIWLGTGPIKGFGVTLAIGIGTTLFCALVVSRALLELFVNTNIIKKLLPFSFLKPVHMDYLKYRVKAYSLSILIAIVGVIAVAVNHSHIFGIDFIGGDELTIRFEEKLGIQEIDEVAKNNGLGEVIPLYQSLLGDNKEVLKLQTEHGKGPAVLAALEKAYPNAQLEMIGETSIGGSVSDSIKTDALLAVAVALIGILLYVAFRFEWGFGIGAVVSTIHDIVLTIGIYVLLGGQFSASMVAAILMIVGYSINDTIVVFDRIREELDLHPEMKLWDIINLSINRTLSRTILTSLTTFMAALALFIFGAGVIKDFALVFIIGIITGTYSSIFIASPIFYWWHKGDRKHVAQREITPKYHWEETTTSVGSDKK